MTTSETYGPCTNTCGREARVRLYNRGTISMASYTPLCFECFRADHNDRQVSGVIAEPPTRPPAPPIDPKEPWPPQIDVQYDYDNQAWSRDGKYVRCGHPESMDCKCYGKEHEGEPFTDPNPPTRA